MPRRVNYDRATFKKRFQRIAQNQEEYRFMRDLLDKLTFNGEVVQGALTGKIDVPDDINATGTPSGSTFLNGNGAWATPSGGGGGDVITNLMSDIDSPTYYYYGFERNGDWEILRNTRGDVSTEGVATELNNGGTTTLASAWTNRATLVFA